MFSLEWEAAHPGSVCEGVLGLPMGVSALGFFHGWGGRDLKNNLETLEII